MCHHPSIPMCGQGRGAGTQTGNRTPPLLMARTLLTRCPLLETHFPLRVFITELNCTSLNHSSHVCLNTAPSAPMGVEVESAAETLTVCAHATLSTAAPGWPVDALRELTRQVPLHSHFQVKKPRHRTIKPLAQVTGCLQRGGSRAPAARGAKSGAWPSHATDDAVTSADAAGRSHKPPAQVVRDMGCGLD